MKDIDLVDAFNMLRLCEGIALEGRLLEISLIGIENNPDNEFAYLFWSEDIRGEMVDFEVVFREGDNEQVRIDGPYMTLVNADGQEEELMLMKSWNFEDEI